jgi:hypothetical protein
VRFASCSVVVSMLVLSQALKLKLLVSQQLAVGLWQVLSDLEGREQATSEALFVSATLRQCLALVFAPRHRLSHLCSCPGTARSSHRRTQTCSLSAASPSLALHSFVHLASRSRILASMTQAPRCGPARPRHLRCCYSAHRIETG